MRTGLLCIATVTTAALAVSVAAASAGGEKPIVVRDGDIVMKLNGGAWPKALPKHRLAPVIFRASGQIGTADGTHPPALREVTLDAGKAGTIEANAFPKCSQGQLEATTTRQAESKCGNAIVGRGEASVEVAFPEQRPFTARGPLVIFNGGQKGGESLLFIHAYIAVPAPTAVITPVVTTREHKGPYRLHSVARIPVVAGGAGSATYFSLKIDRRGYLTANCGNGHFSAHVTARFAGGSELAGGFQRPCRATG